MKLLFAAVMCVIGLSVVAFAQQQPSFTDWQWQETKDRDWKDILGKGVKDPTDKSDVTQHDTQGKGDEQGGSKVAPINTDPGSSRHQHYAKQARQAVEWITTNEKTAMVLFTGVLAIVGVLQIGLIIFQAGYGWRAASAAKKSADAATESAKAAMKSADVAENALRIVERPYVALNWEVEGNVIWCVITNMGRTPATFLGHYFDPQVAPACPDFPYPGIRLQLDTMLQNISLPSQGKWRIPKDLSTADLRAMNSGNGRLWIFTYIITRDEFGGEEHVSALMKRYAEEFFVVDRPGYNYTYYYPNKNKK